MRNADSSHHHGGSSSNLSSNDSNGEVLGAQTGPTFGVGGGGDVPGAPNTGAGGAAVFNIIFLVLGALMVAAGSYILARRLKS